MKCYYLIIILSAIVSCMPLRIEHYGKFEISGFYWDSGAATVLMQYGEEFIPAHYWDMRKDKVPVWIARKSQRELHIYIRPVPHYGPVECYVTVDKDQQRFRIWQHNTKKGRMFHMAVPNYRDNSYHFYQVEVIYYILDQYGRKIEDGRQNFSFWIFFPTEYVY